MVKYLKSLEQYGDRIAFRCLDGTNTYEVTYSQYLKDIRRCSYKLQAELGELSNLHIGIYEQSGYEYIVLLSAIIFARAVAIPINVYETYDNIIYAIDNARLDALIADDWTFPKSELSFPVFSRTDFLSQEENELFLADFDDNEKDHLSLIMFTSGTTSLSKGVAISARSLFEEKKVALPKEYAEGIKNCVGMRGYTNFPYYHIGGICVWLSWTENGCITYLSVNPSNILSDLENEEIDCAGVIPATLKLWEKALKREKYERLGNAKHILTGGAAVGPELIGEYTSRGISFGQYYGMTELGGFVTCNYDVEKHAKSVGKAINGAEISVVDGEICIKYSGNMLGYYNNEEETEKCMKNGVVYTGDLGYLDEDGYLFLTGRKKNLIILSGGENVSPEELERLLYANPSIKECKVYEKNDRIYADIYCNEEKTADVKIFVEKLNKKVPIYKRIFRVKFRNQEFEKTASGKIKR